MNDNPSIKVIGVGGAGANMIERMAAASLGGVSFALLNTDAAAIERSCAQDKIHLESKLMRGLGTGGDPDLGSAVAEEQSDRIRALCEGADVILVAGGLGGGLASGACPVVARLAREAGALVLGLVTLPFACEGTRRSSQARHGLERLKAEADGVLCLHNQKVFGLIDENTTVRETFDLTNRYIVDGLRGIWQLLNCRGLIDVHFADLCSVLRGRHTEGSFALAEADGPNRSIEILDRLLTHPFLDGGQVLGFADEVVISLMGGADLTMQEVNRVMEQVTQHCGTARITMGAAIDEEWNNRLCVTLFTTCRREGEERIGQEDAGRSDNCDNRASALEMNAQLLDHESGRRPPSRVVPPAPQLDEQAREQLMARKAARGARTRQAGRKLKQGQLPLEVISRGRFDKSEPTIHKGEDLDLPTYIRRGVVLN